MTMKEMEKEVAKMLKQYFYIVWRKSTEELHSRKTKEEVEAGYMTMVVDTPHGLLSTAQAMLVIAESQAGKATACHIINIMKEYVKHTTVSL